MPQIKILKTPGFLYDLNFMFYLKFNTKYFIDNLPDKERKKEDIKYFNELLAKFGDIPDDLYVFFNAVENGRCFMTTCYLKPYKNEYPKGFDFDFFINELSDEREFVRRLIGFYFYKLTPEEINECAASSSKLFSVIKSSDYSYEEKTHLYEFFAEPSAYIKKLLVELARKEAWLSEYYKENYDDILTAHNGTTFEVLKKRMEGLKDLSFLEAKETGYELYVSYCLMNKYFIDFVSIDNGIFYLLGNDYISIITPIKNQKTVVDLETFGNALGDPSRVKIFDYILNKGSVTCKDLERTFDFSGSTAYHHVTLMTRSGVLITKNEGKTVYYMINHKLMTSIGTLMLNIGKGQKGSII